MSTLNISLSESTDAGGQKEVTLGLVGHLDNSTVASLQMQLSTALSAKPSHVIFDLANLRYVTSSGIRLFFASAKQQQRHGGRLSFVNLQPQIQEVFDIMGKLPEMRVFKSQAELDAYRLLGEDDGAPFSFNNDAELDVYLRARQSSHSSTSPRETNQ